MGPRIPWRFPCGVLEINRLSDANSIFEAHAFHPSFGNEAIAGHILVSRWQFRFQSETAVFEIPLERLRVRAGKGSDERLYFRDREQPDLEIITDDFAIVDLPEVGRIDNLAFRLSAEAGRHELWRRMRIVGCVILVCVVVAGLGQLLLSFMVRSLVANLPPKLEQDIGTAMIAEFQQEAVLVEDTNRVAALAALAAPLTQTIGNGRLPFTYYLAEDDDPNAFALPGGHVIVNTGLLKLADRPEQILGVLAHEVAHVTQKHGVRKAIASAGPFLIFRVFLGGNNGGLVEVAGAASDLLISQSFSQEYETEADDIGWQSLVAARIDPRGMAEMFRKLEAAEREHHLPGLELPQALQSHPALEKRIARLEKKYAKLKPSGNFQDLAELKVGLKSAAGK